MDNNLIESVKKKLYLSGDSLFEFANFVNDIEFFAEQNKGIFKNNDLIKEYNDIWFELEILNACALSEWEEEKKPKDFGQKWRNKYENDAIELLKKLDQFLSSI